MKSEMHVYCKTWMVKIEKKKWFLVAKLNQINFVKPSDFNDDPSVVLGQWLCIANWYIYITG